MFYYACFVLNYPKRIFLNFEVQKKKDYSRNNNTFFFNVGIKNTALKQNIFLKKFLKKDNKGISDVLFDK